MDQNIYLARHPIFDKFNNIFAYEVLYRSETGNSFPDINGETATRSLLHRALMDFGLDNISNGKKLFINFTEELLNEKAIDLIPPDRIVIEILETVEPTNEILSRCIELKEKGFEFALDDFEYDDKWIEFIKISSYIKVDFHLVLNSDRKDIIKKISNNNITLIAEKVESYLDYKQARDLGYDFFQGYYFSKPSMLTTMKIPENKMNYFLLLQEINNPDTEFDILETYIRRDISLTYKLLKFINSSFYSFQHEISSIRQALTLLGLNELKKWIALVAMDKLIGSKPQELIKLSLTRALFSEALGRILDTDIKHEEFFLMGLFSLIDAILDKPRIEILEEIKLNELLKKTLTGKRTELTAVLELIVSIENDDFQLIDIILNTMEVNHLTIFETYLNAVTIAETLINN